MNDLKKIWLLALGLAFCLSGCAGMARSQAESAITVENQALPADYSPDGHTLLVVRAVPLSDGTIWEPDQHYLDQYNSAAQEAFTKYAGEYAMIDVAELDKETYQDRQKYRYALIATVSEVDNFGKRARWLHTHLRDLRDDRDMSPTDRQTPAYSLPILEVWVERLNGPASVAD